MREPWAFERQHPFFDIAEWRQDVCDGSTLRGYDGWVEASIEAAEEENIRGYYTPEEYGLRKRGAK